METLFVYGTLKKNGKWHQLLAQEKYLGSDSVDGELYLEKGGYYPILFKGTEVVHGELYEVSPEAYEKVMALESDADYDIQTVQTHQGRVVKVFFFQDLAQKIPSQKITDFDADFYFQKWLKTQK